jgi:hypothetical protein
MSKVEQQIFWLKKALQCLEMILFCDMAIKAGNGVEHNAKRKQVFIDQYVSYMAKMVEPGIKKLIANHQLKAA